MRNDAATAMNAEATGESYFSTVVTPQFNAPWL